MPGTVLYEQAGHAAARTRTMSWVEAVRFGETMRIVAGATEDAAEGIAAWAESRPPDWQAR